MALGWFILGFSLLVATLLIARAFVGADPKTLVRIVRWTALGAAGVVIVFLAVTGRLVAALPLLFMTLVLARRLPRFSFPNWRATPSAGQTSEVKTQYLAMTLDHDTGDMQGQVLLGRFAGRALSDLGFEELVELLQECLRDDQQAARILETYLDRTQAEDWRERAAGATGGGPGGQRMNPEEALEILGLQSGASPDEIKQAHHRLMQKIHPDHGGSTYLASKINQAKDVLLRA